MLEPSRTSRLARPNGIRRHANRLLGRRPTMPLELSSSALPVFYGLVSSAKPFAPGESANENGCLSNLRPSQPGSNGPARRVPGLTRPTAHPACAAGTGVLNLRLPAPRRLRFRPFDDRRKASPGPENAGVLYGWKKPESATSLLFDGLVTLGKAMRGRRQTGKLEAADSLAAGLRTARFARYRISARNFRAPTALRRGGRLRSCGMSSRGGATRSEVLRTPTHSFFFLQ